MRHVMKVSLTAGIVAVHLVAINSIVPRLQSPSFAQAISVGSKISVTNPKYSGFTRSKNRNYEVTASAGTFDAGLTSGFSLEQPRASLEVADGKRLSLRGTAGVFDVKNGILRMQGDVVLTTVMSQEIHMSEATVDVNKNTVMSAKPFEMKSADLTVQGKRLEGTEDGFIQVFDGSLNRDGNVINFKNFIIE